MTQQAYRSGVAHVNNTELYYDVAGAGHPITLAHGLLLDRGSWDDQFGVFARLYTVVRYDLRGWGDSAQEPAEPPYSPRQDLLSLLDTLNIHTTYLLGLSGAGTITLDFTLEHPERVDALILVASGLSGYPQRMTESIQAFIGQYYGALQRKDIASAAEATVRFWTDGPRRSPEQVNAQARARITDIATQHLQRHGDLMAHQQHMLPLEPPAVHRLTEVKAPTLIVVGDLDTPEILEIADTLERGIAGAKKRVIPGTAHHPHMLLENQRFRMPAGLDRVQVPALIVAGQHEVAMMRRSARDLAAALPAGQAYLVATSLRGAEEHSWNLQRPELFNAVTRAWLTDHPLPPGLLPLQ